MDERLREIREVNDSLDSMHRRMDKFYEWASLLQKEFRDMQQRLKFLESQSTIEFFNAESALQDRLHKVKHASCSGERHDSV